MMDGTGILEKLRNSTGPKIANLFSRLQQLTPGRLCLMLKYLILDENDPIQLLTEYFEIALEFTALGVLIRKATDAKTVSRSMEKLNRMAFDSMLRAAMKRLRDSALRVHSLEGKAKELEFTHGSLLYEKEKLEAERSELLERIKEAMSDTTERRNAQVAVAEASERLMEGQTWHEDKMFLVQEVESLRREREMFNAEKKQACKHCQTKERLIADLREQLQEREFFMMASAEEVKVAQDEKNELSSRLAIAEIIEADLKEDFGRQVEQHKLDQQKYKDTIDKMMAEKQVADLLNEKLRMELELLREVTATIEQKNSLDCAVEKSFVRVEEETLQMQTAMAAMQIGNADLVEEGNRRSKMQITQQHSVECLGSEGKEIIGKLHVDVLGNRHFMYTKQANALQNKLKISEQNVAEMEERMFYPPYDEYGLLIHCKGENSGSNRENLLFSQTNLVGPGVGDRQLLLSNNKQLLTPYIIERSIEGQEVDVWKNLYFAVKRTIGNLEKDISDTGVLPQISQPEKLNIYLQKLEMRHFEEIAAFERQMRMRDERMEAFRKHLMLMELDSHRSQMEIEHLKSRLIKTQDEIMKIQGGKGIGSSTPMPILLTEEPHYPDSQKELATTNKKTNSKDSVMGVTEIYPRAKEIMQAAQNLDANKSHSKRSVENQLNKVELGKENAGKLPICRPSNQFSLGFQGFSLGSYATRRYFENLTTNDTKIMNAVDAACLEADKLLEAVAEANGLDQEDICPGGHVRVLVDHADRISRLGEMLKKLRSLLSSTKEMQSYILEQGLKKMESEYKVYKHERETISDMTFRGMLLPKGAWEKETSSPLYNPAEQKGSKVKSLPNIRSVLNQLAQRDDMVLEEQKQVSSYGRKLIRGDLSESVQNHPFKLHRRHSTVSVQDASSEFIKKISLKPNRRHSTASVQVARSESVENFSLKHNKRHLSESVQAASSEPVQNMQFSKWIKPKVEAPNKLQMLKQQIFG